MNNSEYLNGLAARGDGSLQAWFDAEHVEGTNGIDGETNGIVGDVPLVDEPSEDDAIEHARWRWKYRPEDGDEVVMSEYNCNLLMGDLDAIADMVERDYVLRSIFDAVCAERDELKAMDDRLQVALDTVEGCDERCKKLESERDEWKAKAEHYGGHVDRLMDAIRDLARKQPWTFDPEAPYKNAELVGKYIDELEAKAEAKSAKRAAAAERVRKAKDAGTSIGYAIVGREYYPWEAYEALIDLLTDEPMDALRDGNGTCPDAMGQSSDASTLGDLFGVLGDEEPHGEPDSREKLEADAHRLTDAFTDTYSDDAELFGHIIELFDRLTAIVERDVRTYLNREDSELIQAKVDNLQGQIEHLREEIAKRDKGIARLKRQRDEAHAQLENLATDLAECSREREAYRRACGELLDYADQMRLVRLDGCGPALAGMGGEVV